MLAKNLLNCIQELGYRYELIGNDTLKFSYTRDGETPKEAIPILKQVKEHKQEVLTYLRQTARPDAQKPTSRQYELTEADFRLDEYIGKLHMNPNRYPGAKCGAVAGRYCLGQGKDSRWWWAWWCLECRPYTEPERH